jgi:hypothetical protein
VGLGGRITDTNWEVLGLGGVGNLKGLDLFGLGGVRGLFVGDIVSERNMVPIGSYEIW